MADNVTLNSGSGGATLKTDELADLSHVQYIKLMDGTANGTGVIPGDATNGLLVNLGSNNDVTVTGTVTVDGSGVTQPVSAASLPLPTGAATSANQTTIIGHVDGIETLLGTIDADTGTIAGAVAGTEMQCDIVAALPAGTNNIGDVDVLSVVPGTSATSLGKAVDSAAGATDTGVAVLAVRDDALSALTPIEGDYVPLRVSSTGALHVTGGGGGTQYNVDDAAGSTDTGNVLLAVRDDSLTTLTPIDGDYTPLRVSSTGALHVTGGGGGTEYTEDVATPATIVGTATMMERDDALATLTPIEGDWAAMRCDANGALWTAVNNTVTVADGGGSLTVDGTVAVSGTVAVTDNAGSLTVDNSTLAVVGGGTEATAMRVTIASDSTGVLSIDDNGGSLTVDGTVSATCTNAGTFVTQENGAALTALQVIDNPVVVDDAAFTPATTSVMMAGFEFDDVTPDSVNEGDAGAARMSANRCQYVMIRDNAGNERGLNIDASGQLAVTNAGTFAVQATLQASTNTTEVVGDAAHDAAAAGNPVLVAASAETMADSAPANRVSADADASRLSCTDGALYVIPTGPQTWSYHSNGSAALTDATVHAAPGAGLSLYVTDIVFSSGAATAINAFFEESTTTVLGPYYLEAVAGRGCVIHFQTPKKITANTALTVTTSAAIAHAIDVTGFIAPG